MMLRTRCAITLLTLWLATFFAGPIVPAFAVNCAMSSSGVHSSAPADCPMQHGASESVRRKACCCCSATDALTARIAAPSAADTVTATASGCDCSVQQGPVPLPAQRTEAPLPGIVLALADAPILAVVPPLAHLAADAPLPPFAARLQLPQRARDTGRAPPTA